MCDSGAEASLSLGFYGTMCLSFRPVPNYSFPAHFIRRQHRIRRLLLLGRDSRRGHLMKSGRSVYPSRGCLYAGGMENEYLTFNLHHHRGPITWLFVGGLRDGRHHPQSVLSRCACLPG